jgi:LysM repeat protein
MSTRLSVLVLVVCAALVGVSATVKCQPSADQWFCYTVQPGDSISKIAEAQHVHPGKLCDYNKPQLNYDCDKLSVGDELQIPLDQCHETTAYSCHTAVKGESVGTVAEIYAVMTNTLWDYNKDVLYNNDYSHFNLWEGMQLRIPKFECSPSLKNFCYTAVEGDNLYSMAAAHSLDAGVFYFSNADRMNAVYKVIPGRQYLVPRLCQPSPDNYFFYKIRVNDTVFNLGKRFNVDSDYLCKFNELQDCKLIRAAESLKIPIKPANNTLQE